MTPVGETDNATIMNGIRQGSFAAALTSSLNIGCAVDGITWGICPANLGEVIAKMNRTLEDAKGCKRRRQRPTLRTHVSW